MNRDRRRDGTTGIRATTSNRNSQSEKILEEYFHLISNLIISSHAPYLRLPLLGEKNYQYVHIYMSMEQCT
jgi:hypothetical protein